MKPKALLITAGPTQEPIDAVRFIGNRSSGRMGSALADRAAADGWSVTLLLGPASVTPSHARVTLRRFRTCEDLRGLLKEEAPRHDVVVMAAAVADYRPKVDPAFQGGKFRRQDQKLTLELEPTPDLLAEASAARRPGQLFVGFALEPEAELEESAKKKLDRKKVDLVVANPLQTMDSPTIRGSVYFADGRPPASPAGTAGAALPKEEFARWLLDVIARAAGITG